jgi:hypothetical protein
MSEKKEDTAPAKGGKVTKEELGKVKGFLDHHGVPGAALENLTAGNCEDALFALATGGCDGCCKALGCEPAAK